MCVLWYAMIELNTYSTVVVVHRQLWCIQHKSQREKRMYLCIYMPMMMLMMILKWDKIIIELNPNDSCASLIKYLPCNVVNSIRQKLKYLLHWKTVFCIDVASRNISGSRNIQLKQIKIYIIVDEYRDVLRTSWW